MNEGVCILGRYRSGALLTNRRKYLCIYCIQLNDANNVPDERINLLNNVQSRVEGGA